ncbi:TonB-dependent receptor [Caulobacter segnis]|uniref:TonB-dependent receptor plug domain-containing protein n=1 Tax=Caulobacter segnis TaxID=88688 RepID=UPI002410923D|nr:TonB-dependent receptor [Caulobacter segnis]MDG2523136.1 TonB-dependent receptor [Caulobacter segnis]
MNTKRMGRSLLMMSTALSVAVLAGQAWAQDDAAVEEIVVVGTRIEGSKVTAALPVTVVGQQDLDAISASSGDELFRSIPQMGDINYNSSYLPNSSNSARGDIGSVNLRNLGSGNTLVLLNGRRVVAHPTSQADGASLVPTITYNTNAIPTTGLKRLEVLRDGAAALYGSDAVAGVINTVLQDRFEGAEVEARYGEAEGTNLEEYNFTALVGHNFDRGNLTAFFSYDKRSELRSTDQDFTASSDYRPLFAGTRFDGAASLDSRGTQNPWGNFTARSAVRRNGALLTSAAGAFHIQPTSFAGCLANVAAGACIDDGALATAGAERDLRYDTAAAGVSIMPSLKRSNLFLTGNYDLTEEVTAFGELGLYRADTEAWQNPIYTTTAQVLTAPGSNYYNPFGATGLPNRLSGIDAPAAGVGVNLTTYNFVDAGRQFVEVANEQNRFLVGLKGKKFGFNWETAALYNSAKVEDVSDGISATLAQQQLSLSTPDAYNPFNGGDPALPSIGDATSSTAAAINAIKIKSQRTSKSTLALWDLKVSKADLFALPGGDVGVAAGVEYRRETQKDDRDARVDGTTKFTNPITGVVYDSDLIGTSPSPDTKGSREVASAFIEFAVPVISPEMGIPLVRSVEAQFAGRFEHFSDVGDVAKPKIAVAWDVFDGLRFRGSWAEGFKAPNLEQVNATLVTRSNTRTDWVRCEADRRAGRIANFANCARSNSTPELRSGNQDLKPEESTNTSVGVVFEPRFVPADLGRFTFTADYWRIKQTGIVGLFGGNNALVLDYLLRTQGQSNPNILRAAPTADDVAAFAGTGLAPVGQVLGVQDQYVNLLPQEARGLDIGVMWRLYGTKFGDFDVNFNAAHLIKFYQSPSPNVATLLDARAAGQINAGTSLSGGGDLIRQNGRPDWRWSASATWRYDRITVGAFSQYIGDVEDTSLVDAAGAPWVVDSQVTANLYAQYEFEGGWADNTRVRIGARNITDEKPPLSSSGYQANLYNPYQRYWYVSVRKSF